MKASVFMKCSTIEEFKAEIERLRDTYRLLDINRNPYKIENDINGMNFGTASITPDEFGADLEILDSSEIKIYDIPDFCSIQVYYDDIALVRYVGLKSIEIFKGDKGYKTNIVLNKNTSVYYSEYNHVSCSRYIETIVEGASSDRTYYIHYGYMHHEIVYHLGFNVLSDIEDTYVSVADALKIERIIMRINSGYKKMQRMKWYRIHLEENHFSFLDEYKKYIRELSREDTEKLYSNKEFLKIINKYK